MRKLLGILFVFLVVGLAAGSSIRPGVGTGPQPGGNVGGGRGPVGGGGGIQYVAVPPENTGDGIEGGDTWTPVVDNSGADVFYFDPAAGDGGDGSLESPYQAFGTELVAGTIGQYNHSHVKQNSGDVEPGDVCVLLPGSHGYINFDEDYYFDDWVTLYAYSSSAVFDSMLIKEVDMLVVDGLNAKHIARHDWESGGGSGYQDAPYQVHVTWDGATNKSDKIIFYNCNFGNWTAAQMAAAPDIETVNLHTVDCVRLWQVDRVLFEDCTFEGGRDGMKGGNVTNLNVVSSLFNRINGDGITLGRVDTLSIVGNTIKNIYHTDEDHCDGIQLWGPNDYGMIRRNEFIAAEETDWSFGYINEGGNYGTGFLLADMTDEGLGFVGEYHNNLTIQNNVLMMNQWGAIQAESARGTEIVNNTLVSLFSDPTSIYGVGCFPMIITTQDTTFQNRIYNNICGGISVNNNDDTYSWGEDHFNLTYSNDFSSAGFVFWQADTTATVFDLRLDEGSTAVDYGMSSGAPTIDYAGDDRPRNDYWDAGAYEHQSGKAQPTYTSHSHTFEETQSARLMSGTPDGSYPTATTHILNSMNDSPPDGGSIILMDFAALRDSLNAGAVVDSATLVLKAYNDFDVAATDSLIILPMYGEDFSYWTQSDTTSWNNPSPGLSWPTGPGSWQLGALSDGADGTSSFPIHVRQDMDYSNGDTVEFDITNLVALVPEYGDDFAGFAMWHSERPTDTANQTFHSHNAVEANRPDLDVTWRRPWTAPIEGGDGTFADGESYTIFGSGFGSKGSGPENCGPIMYDDFEDGTPGDWISDAYAEADVGEWYIWQKASAPYNYVPIYADTTWGGVSCQRVSGHQNALQRCPPANNNSGMATEIYPASKIVYFFGHVYNEPLSLTDHSENFKWISCRGGGPGEWLVPNFRCDGWPNLGAHTPGIYTLDCSGNWPGNEYGYGPVCDDFEFPDQWYNVEAYVDMGSDGNSDGEYRFVVDRGQVYSAAMSDVPVLQDTGCAGFTNIKLTSSVDNDSDVDGGSNPDNDFADYYISWDEAYIDSTQARIALADSFLYDYAENVEIQIPTRWADDGDSITFTVNTGAIAEGDSAYLFVFDRYNNRSAGFGVVVGGEDTTPPDTNGVFASFAVDSTTVPGDIELELGLDGGEAIQSELQWSINGSTWWPASPDWDPAAATAEAYTDTMPTGIAVSTNPDIYLRWKIRDTAETPNESDYMVRQYAAADWRAVDGGASTKTIMFVISHQSTAYDVTGTTITYPHTDTESWTGEIHVLDGTDTDIAEATIKEYSTDRGTSMGTGDSSLEVLGYDDDDILDDTNEKVTLLHLGAAAIDSIQAYTNEDVLTAQLWFMITSQAWAADDTLRIGLVNQVSTESWETYQLTAAPDYGDASYTYLDTEATTAWTSQWFLSTLSSLSDAVTDSVPASEVGSGSWAHVDITPQGEALVEDDDTDGGLLLTVKADSGSEQLQIYSQRGGNADSMWFVVFFVEVDIE